LSASGTEYAEQESDPQNGPLPAAIVPGTLLVLL
jgi:hypothetical protein